MRPIPYKHHHVCGQFGGGMNHHHRRCPEIIIRSSNWNFSKDDVAVTLRVKNWDSRNRCEKHHHHPSDDHFQCGSLPVLVNHKPQWLQRIATGILMTVVEAKMQFPQLTSLNGPAQNEPSKPLYAPTYLPLHNIPVQTICFRELTITILIISTKTLPMMMIIIITALSIKHLST